MVPKAGLERHGLRHTPSNVRVYQFATSARTIDPLTGHFFAVPASAERSVTSLRSG